MNEQLLVKIMLFLGALFILYGVGISIKQKKMAPFIRGWIGKKIPQGLAWTDWILLSFYMFLGVFLMVVSFVI